MKDLETWVSCAILVTVDNIELSFPSSIYNLLLSNKAQLMSMLKKQNLWNREV